VINLAKKETLQLLCNVFSIDIYEKLDHKTTILSNNFAFDMTHLVQETLKIKLPDKLCVLNIHNFYSVVIPVSKNHQLIVVPHINTTNTPDNFRQLTHFINNLYSLSRLIYETVIEKQPPTWEIYLKTIPTIKKKVNFAKSESLEIMLENENILFKSIHSLDYQSFQQALTNTMITDYMGEIFEKNGFLRGKKDVMIRFICLMVNQAINTKQAKTADIFKLEDDILGKIEFKKDPPPISLWKVQLATQFFFDFKDLVKKSSLSLAGKCVNYIQNNITKKLTVTEIAAELNCSTSSLVHQFKNEYHLTINTYIKNQKIEAAKYMLKNSSINISEIAYTLAYNDPNYFMKVFKNNTGITPKTYRQTFLTLLNN
jgi:AraC-like DNA-binding protein